MLPLREVRIDETHAGQRIDNFLITFLKGLPRSRIYRCLRRGEVRVNKGRVRQHYRLRPGDVVRVPPVQTRPAGIEPVLPAAISDQFAAAIGNRILYEDPMILVVDKPAGFAVHGGSGISLGIIEALRQSRSDSRSLELVHRLDKETSGCLVVAKRRSTLTALHAAFREGQVDKRYLAVVRGRWDRRERVSASLVKNRLRSGERLVRPAPHGSSARTEFIPIRIGTAATFVEARPLTGRTHQIRVHASTRNHPIAGDSKYGDHAFNRSFRELGLKRMFLHAGKLSFVHPGTGVTVAIESPLPADLAQFLHRCGLAAFEDNSLVGTPD